MCVGVVGVWKERFEVRIAMHDTSTSRQTERFGFDTWAHVDK